MVDNLATTKRHHTECQSWALAGEKLGTDAFVVTLRSAEISLRLPVRQLSVLQSWSLPVFWQTVRLDVMPSATVDQHNSYLMLHLKGELRAFEPNAS